MQLTKHVGVEQTTKARITLLMTSLPPLNEDCLIVYTDNIPPALKDSFIHVLNTPEGQSTTNLSEVLGRRLFSDSGTDILNTMHQMGLIKKVRIDDVMMTPTQAHSIPLRTVLVESGLIARRAEDVDATKFNPHHHNARAANVGEATGTARNMLIEANMLEQAAAAKRTAAYEMAPSLRPGGAPDTSENVDIGKKQEAPVAEAPPAAPAAPALDLLAAYSDADQK